MHKICRKLKWLPYKLYLTVKLNMVKLMMITSDVCGIHMRYNLVSLRSSHPQLHCFIKEYVLTLLLALFLIKQTFKLHHGIFITLAIIRLLKILQVLFQYIRAIQLIMCGIPQLLTPYMIWVGHIPTQQHAGFRSEMQLVQPLFSILARLLITLVWFILLQGKAQVQYLMNQKKF